MRGLALDCETYYDRKLNLRSKSLTTFEYVTHRKFHVHGWAVCEVELEPVDSGVGLFVPGRVVSRGEVRWVSHDEVYDVIAGTGPAPVLMAHNAAFDALVLRMNGPAVPIGMWVDTRDMARAVYNSDLKSAGLDALGKMAGVGEKVHKESLGDVIGLTTDDIRRMPGLWKKFVDYAKNDVALMLDIYEWLRHRVPNSEMATIDWCVRMNSEPQIALDMDAIEGLLHDCDIAEASTSEWLAAHGLTPSDMRSPPRAKAAFEAFGVEVAMKYDKNRNRIPALAKDDFFFQRLLHGKDVPDEVKRLARAKAACGSNLTKSRAVRLKNMGSVFGDKVRKPSIPVPLRYAGARRTKRFSGSDGINLQNLNRDPEVLNPVHAGVDADPVYGRSLRGCLVAPDGCKLVVVDSSNIELRVSAAVSGQWDVLERLANKKDEYATFAERVFNKPVSKKETPMERTVGKVAVLSLGYNAAARSFQLMLAQQAKLLMPLEECQGIVDSYRSTYSAIAGMWPKLDEWMRGLARGGPLPTVPSAPIEVVKAEGRDITVQCVRPGGGSMMGWTDIKTRTISYIDEDTGERVSKDSLTYYNAERSKADGTRAYASIYGGLIMENICQFLAREVVTWQAMEIRRRCNRLPALQVHDELVYVVPEGEADAVLDLSLEVMSQRLPWWPELVVDAEGGVADIYQEAK